MSLNFVSSAVLTSTDGVSHNEEKSVETGEASSVRRQQAAGGHQPLFEQLRSNADRTQEERDAAAKALRGTRTLDEEDCAHLDAIERQRMERDAAVRRGVEDEVAAFRAARAERMAEGSAELMDDNEDGGGDATGGGEGGGRAVGVIPAASAAPAAAPAVKTTSSLAAMAPKIVVKKKRRRRPDGDSSAGGDAGKRLKEAANEETNTTTSNAEVTPKDEVGTTSDDGDGKGKKKDDCAGDESDDSDNGDAGLGGLLGGYGTDSDSD
mmetsp:Transcript_26338/g.53493  ORF Transcript_26338/g.53493 Transcript_26338/m.53493 type:complete len:266 (-) Transcript_26338:1229-2026(-)